MGERQRKIGRERERYKGERERDTGEKERERRGERERQAVEKERGEKEKNCKHKKIHGILSCRASLRRTE